MKNVINILLVEDDRNLGLLLKENFDAKGFSVHVCRDGEEGLRAMLLHSFDLFILDVMLPKKDGFTLAREIRARDPHTPIIFLTAKCMEEDRIQGFEIGADDYVTKPFSAKELFLRVKAILRRMQPGEEETLTEKFQIGNFSFDYRNRVLILNDQQRHLSTKEAALLKIMADHKNTLLNRSTILKHVWGSNDYFASKSMDVYLTRLRKMLREDASLEIQNIHGTGFILVEKQEAMVAVAR